MFLPPFLFKHTPFVFHSLYIFFPAFPPEYFFLLSTPPLSLVLPPAVCFSTLSLYSISPFPPFFPHLSLTPFQAALSFRPSFLRVSVHSGSWVFVYHRVCLYNSQPSTVFHSFLLPFSLSLAHYLCHLPLQHAHFRVSLSFSQAHTIFHRVPSSLLTPLSSPLSSRFHLPYPSQFCCSYTLHRPFFPFYPIDFTVSLSLLCCSISWRLFHPPFPCYLSRLFPLKQAASGVSARLCCTHPSLNSRQCVNTCNTHPRGLPLFPSFLFIFFISTSPFSSPFPLLVRAHLLLTLSSTGLLRLSLFHPLPRHVLYVPTLYTPAMVVLSFFSPSFFSPVFCRFQLCPPLSRLCT